MKWSIKIFELFIPKNDESFYAEFHVTRDNKKLFT